MSFEAKAKLWMSYDLVFGHIPAYNFLDTQFSKGLKDIEIDV